MASRVSRFEIGEWVAICKLLVPSIAKFLVTSSIGFGGRNPATPPKSPRREWARDPQGQNPRVGPGVKNKQTFMYVTFLGEISVELFSFIFTSLFHPGRVR